MRESILLGFHAFAFLQYLFTCYCDNVYFVVPKNVMKIFSSYGGKLQFLTIWNVILQAIFFLICTINDLYGTNAINPKKPPFIRKLKDYTFATLVFPVSMFVSTTFWVLMFIDRELVLPKILDPYFPWWLNHLLHTVIVITTLLELVLASRKYPKRSHGICILIIFTLIYVTWMQLIHYLNGTWPYPIFELLSPIMRLVFFGFSGIFALLLYLIGESLDKYFWDNEKMKQHKSHSK